MQLVSMMTPNHKVFATLSILAVTSKSNIASSNILRLLAVGQPPSDGQFQLPGVVVELEHIRTLIRNSPSVRTTLIESSVGTVEEEVLALMKEASHGIQDDLNPNLQWTLSRERTPSQNIRRYRVVATARWTCLSFFQHARLQRVTRLSDEAIHIAAGMLFAGYGGVIGTMWSINDKIAPDEQLFHKNGIGIPDYREAARALHVGVGRPRENKVLF